MEDTKCSLFPGQTIRDPVNIISSRLPMDGFLGYFVECKLARSVASRGEKAAEVTAEAFNAGHKVGRWELGG